MTKKRKAVANILPFQDRLKEVKKRVENKILFLRPPSLSSPLSPSSSLNSNTSSVLHGSQTQTSSAAQTTAVAAITAHGAPGAASAPSSTPSSSSANTSLVSHRGQTYVASSAQNTTAPVIATPSVPGTSSGVALQLVPANTAKSLWEQAVEKLTSEDRNTFNFSDPDKRNTLLEVIQAVRVKEEQCIDKQWKFRKQNGEEVVLRNIVDSLLTRLNRYAAIGDIAIQHSPGGGVALAWAGFRFLLQIALNDTETWSNIFTALEYITHTLSRCAIYEFLYVKNSSQLESAQHLVSSLPDLYASILKYLCASKRFFGSNTAVRITRGALSPYIITFQPLIDEIKTQETRVEKDARVAAEEVQHSAILVADQQSFDQRNRTEKLRHILEGMQVPLSEITLGVVEVRQQIQQGFEGQGNQNRAIQHAVEETKEHIKIKDTEARLAYNGKERLEILMWLSKITFEDHHTFVCLDRLAETGEWLLRKPEFGEWHNSASSSILWLHGIAGAGKTKLASFVIDTFRDGKIDGDALAYFYCNYKEDERRDPECILRSIVKQLSTVRPGSALLESLVSLYRERKRDGFRAGPPQIDESKGLILGLAEAYKQTVIVIDALDECEKETRHKLLSVLQCVLSESKGRVKVFITSRDDDDIVLHLDGLPNIYIRSSDNHSDIRNYITTEVEKRIREKKILRGFVTQALKELIISTLIKGAHGMFLWVHLQIINICREKTATAVEKALTRLPRDLKQAFLRILARIEDQTDDSSFLAKKALTFIMCAQRPLSPNELIEALCIEPMEMEWKMDDSLTGMTILDVCQNLVVIDMSETVHVLRFAHLSVQDFLQEQFGLSQSHAQVAEVCLTFLCWPNHASENPKLRGEMTKSHAFADYSTKNWAVHVRLSDTAVGGSLMELQKEFLSLGPAYTAWCLNLRFEKGNFYNFYVVTPEGFPVAPLLVACYYKLLDICKYLLSMLQEGGVDVNCKDKYGRTPLLMAVEGKCEELVQMLLQIDGVDVNCKDYIGLTPLFWAVRKGYAGIARQLLQEQEVDINCRDSVGRTLLSTAAENGDEALVELLLREKRVDVKCKAHFGLTPLCLAVQKGHTGIVRQLLRRRKASVNCGDRYGRSLLLVAKQNSYKSVVELLQQAKIDLDRGNSMLVRLAREGGNVEAARELLQKEEAEVNHRDENGQTPLSIAAENGSQMVVEMLLQSEDVDVNCPDHKGQTPLHLATRGGHIEVMRQLLRREVNFECKDKDGQTPLSIAVENGIQPAVEVLLQLEGVDVNFRGRSNQTLLHLATRGGHIEVMRQLLRREVNFECKDKDGQTPLSIAVENGIQPAVEVLLQLEGADVNFRGRSNQTLLHLATRGGHIEVMRQLLRKGGVDINCKDEHGQTPLSIAAENGSMALVEALLRVEGVDLSCWDHLGRTPLSLATRRGHIEVVGQLLRKGEMDINCKEKDGRTPLLIAIGDRSMALIEAFLQTELVDVNCKDLFSRTPLFWATRMGHTEVVGQLLRKEGVDINCKDGDGRAPLLIAAGHGRMDLVEALLRVEGVDVNCKDRLGQTPLFWATRMGHTEVVGQLLRKGGVDTNCKDEHGWAPLLIAAGHGRMELVEALLRVEGVDVNCKDRLGRTPLFWATKMGHTEVVGRLLRRGEVDINCKDEDGRTPLSIAAGHGEMALIEALLQVEGVDVNCKDRLDQTPLLRAISGGHIEVVKQLLETEGVSCEGKNGLISASEAVKMAEAKNLRMNLQRLGRERRERQLLTGSNDFLPEKGLEWEDTYAVWDARGWTI